MAGGTPVRISLEEKDEFKLTGKKLKEAITDKTKILVMPFPNNPTGAIMTAEELQVISDICKQHGIFVMSDEIISEIELLKESTFRLAAFRGGRTDDRNQWFFEILCHDRMASWLCSRSEGNY